MRASASTALPRQGDSISRTSGSRHRDSPSPVHSFRVRASYVSLSRVFPAAQSASRRVCSGSLARPTAISAHSSVETLTCFTFAPRALVHPPGAGRRYLTPARSRRININRGTTRLRDVKSMTWESSCMCKLPGAARGALSFLSPAVCTPLLSELFKRRDLPRITEIHLGRTRVLHKRYPINKSMPCAPTILASPAARNLRGMRVLAVGSEKNCRCFEHEARR